MMDRTCEHAWSINTTTCEFYSRSTPTIEISLHVAVTQ